MAEFSFLPKLFFTLKRLKSYLISLWLPSICHMALGAGTEYCQHLNVRSDKAHSCVPCGSTLRKDLRTLSTNISKEIND